MKPEDFSLFGWSGDIPLLDDLWLGMQARNIAMVDLMVIRDVETQALQEWARRERTPLPTLLLLAALSQMWVFSLYEFLRTWRQRARELLDLYNRMRAAPEEQRAKIAEAETEEIRNRAGLIKIAPTWHAQHLETMLHKDGFAEKLQRQFDDWEPLFREVEALRVTLAKHEVPKTGGRGRIALLAEAPGYGRMDGFTGSMYWFVKLKNDAQIKVDRRELADTFQRESAPLPSRDSSSTGEG